MELFFLLLLRAAADVVTRIAGLMIGTVTSTILTLAVIPAIYALWRGWEMRRSVQKV